MAEPREGASPGLVAVLLADVGLELADGVAFALMALVAADPPTGGEWLVLGALIVPRLAMAVIGTVVVRGLLAGTGRRLAVAYASLVAVQGAAGLFLLWGLGQGGPGRTLLAGVNLAAVVAAHRSGRTATPAAPAPEPIATDRPSAEGAAAGRG